MGGILYHVKKPCDSYLTRSNIEPIMLLSRLIVAAETRFRPAKLGLAGLLWILGKTRHLVEASQHATIVCTDPGAALDIARQVTLSTTSTEELNLRQRFRLDIRHKPGELHIVPDALSGLETTNTDSTLKQIGDESELDVLLSLPLRYPLISLPIYPYAIPWLCRSH